MTISQNTLQESLKKPDSVVKIKFDNKIVWLKKASRPHGRYRYTFLSMISHVFKLNFLTPIPNPGGNASLYNEVVRLEHLYNEGIRVPKILEKGPHYLLLEDIGKNFRSILSGSDSYEFKIYATEHVFSELLALHRKKHYLSQAFSRNIVIDEKMRVGFIDFEDNPGLYLSQEYAQTRDILFILFSTCYFFSKRDKNFNELVRKLLLESAPSLREEVMQAVMQLSWIDKIPDVKAFGRDLYRIKLMLTVVTSILGERK